MTQTLNEEYQESYDQLMGLLDADSENRKQRRVLVRAAEEDFAARKREAQKILQPRRRVNFDPLPEEQEAEIREELLARHQPAIDKLERHYDVNIEIVEKELAVMAPMVDVGRLMKER